MDSENKYFVQNTENGKQNADFHPRSALCLPYSGSGFPHSEISGSKPVRGSPKLIAAYHVLHRLSAPRHPPNTLLALDLRSKSENGHSGVPFTPPASRFLNRKDQFCFKHIRELCGQAKAHDWLLSENGIRRTQNRDSACGLVPLASPAVSFPKPDALPLHNVKSSENGKQKTQERISHPSRSLSTASFEVRRPRRA